MTDGEAIMADDRPSSPSSAGGAAEAEMNEVSKEFNRSLSLNLKDEQIVESAESQVAIITDVDTATKDVTIPSASDSPVEPSDETENENGKKFIAPKDFELRKVIGMGAFGKVLQVRNRHSSKIFAMKVISKRLIKRKSSYVENILAERNILSKIANHPFIVTMHASFQTREKLFIIMDFCAGGELFLKLGREGIFRERTAAFYLAEITLALEHLHSINVLHRDLKPENILLGSDGHCRLTDFGLAKDFTGSGDNEDGRARTLCGTMEYMAPEMVARKWYGKGADFWSLGCIAYEMLSGLPPFSSKKGSKELFRKIMNERIRMPDGASAAGCKLLKGLLNRDAGKRLGAARGTMLELGGVGALKQQPFFSGLDWGKLELKEIEPPEDFSVDNDEDLRHFHSEFVNMTLPRSVKEMSKLDFLPKRCESSNFRGFSFIGDSFPLPERSASEQDHYWNNVDDDGQSLSECASSVFDGDLGDFDAPEPVPEKKKRPPRKKKKKQQHIPLETTNEENKTTTNDSIDGKAEKDTDKLQHIDGESGINNGSQKQITEGAVTNESVAQQRKSTPQPTSNNVSTDTTTKSLNPDAKAWSMKPTKPAPQAKMTQPTHTLQPTHPLPQPVATTSYKPKPGTWASLAVGKSKPSTIPAAQTKPVRPVSSSTKLNNWPNKAPIASPMASPRPPSKNSTKASPLTPDW
eukprot:CAMPEP_0183738070 /NCGR_PEP_ID=MMETSP0737-20130205/53690_1 /TAXON_ID=385413 /ORGANISM="Thalassiosira miniscula, Strain CCMP1093" /LENGTH=693 /DNA_ID=CAMNT_0025972517 /DNA_START=53 /DNA_END=2131 /DNA_ORIENTATION=+